jgi:cysteine desulfurase
VLLELERQGVLCSSGSACAAGSDEPSPVLLAMGMSAEVAQTAVRFSFEATITAAELQEAASAVRNAVGSVRALGEPGPVSGAGRGGRPSAARG